MPRKKNFAQPAPTSKPDSLPQRKRGAPLGNTNALKHGLYSKKLTESYIDQFNDLMSQNKRKRHREMKTIRAMILNILPDPTRDIDPATSIVILRAVTQAVSAIYRLEQLSHAAPVLPPAANPLNCSSENCADQPEIRAQNGELNEKNIL